MKIYSLHLLVVYILLSSPLLIAQDPLLDVESSSGGILIPRLTDSLRDELTNLQTGLLIYNISSGRFNFYNGVEWRELRDGRLTEHDCEDGYDNDGDGFIDCLDFDCACDTACAECICDDNIDNDGDGFTDCADLDCSNLTDFECDCDDTLDNDGDGLSDCDDPDCQANFECDCSDGTDNDGDSLTDCNDPDCSGDPSCN